MFPLIKILKLHDQNQIHAAMQIGNFFFKNQKFSYDRGNLCASTCFIRWSSRGSEYSRTRRKAVPKLALFFEHLPPKLHELE